MICVAVGVVKVHAPPGEPDTSQTVVINCAPVRTGVVEEAIAIATMPLLRSAFRFWTCPRTPNIAELSAAAKAGVETVEG